MDPTRALVVYYSRTGTTQTVAHALQEELGCKIDRIADTKPRRGVFGYVRSALDALLGRPTALRPMSTEPRDYELVVIGTPVWNMSLSAPVRAYLAANRDRFRRVAFFCTCGGAGSSRVLRQMKDLCQQTPLSTLVLTEKEVEDGEITAKVRSFAAALRSTSMPDNVVERGELRGAPA